MHASILSDLPWHIRVFQITLSFFASSYFYGFCSAGFFTFFYKNQYNQCEDQQTLNMLQQCAATTREQNNSIEETTQVEEDRVSMDSGDPGRRWTSLKERLGFKGMGCCGSRRRPTSSSFSTMETLQENPHTAPPLSSGMNLAMALAAERNSREEKDEGPATEVKTLMRLIEETDGVDWRKKRRRDNKGVDTDWVCCVCMERSKGAAFIPCGHTFCRVCSREMWVNRGTCPLCNRSILEILDIF